MLGPFYGVSIFLWSALISITLAALSLGYFLGGIAADRRKNPIDLAYILIVAGGLDSGDSFFKTSYISNNNESWFKSCGINFGFYPIFSTFILAGHGFPNSNQN